METNHKANEEIEINLVELIRELWSKAGIIFLSALVMALLVILFETVFVTPKYISTTKMYVLAKQNAETLTSGDLQASTLLTKDYAELVKSRQVTETVIAQLGLNSSNNNMNHEELLEKLTLDTPMDTRVVTISVEDEDPYLAAEIANSIRVVAARHIQNVMNTEAVNTVDQANIPEEPASPKTLRDGVIGGILGAFLGIAVVLLVYLMNDTIKTNDDVERYLHLSTLGTIPLGEGEKKSRRNKQRLRKKNQGR